MAMNLIFEPANSTFHWLKEKSTSTRSFFKDLEPYHPVAASCTIISKIFWKQYSTPRLSKDIKELEKSRSILTVLAKKKIIDKKLLERHNKKIDISKHSLQLSWFDYLSGLSLLYPHPGANIWSSMNNLTGKCFSIYHHTIPLVYSGLQMRTGAATPLALNILHALGALQSLTKELGLIQGNDSVSQTINAASFTAMAIGFVIMAQERFFRKN